MSNITREEAIKRIKEFGLYHAIGDLPNSAKTVEAFNMAIEALQTIDNCDQCEWCCPSDGTPTIHVVRCKDCRKQGSDDCPMFNREWRTIMRGGECVDDFIFHDLTKPSGFCNYGERNNHEQQKEGE